MTTLPTYLPGLMRDAVAAGLNTGVQFFRLGDGAIDAVQIVIDWSRTECTPLGWTLSDGRWVPHRSNLPLRNVRARIRREALR